MSQFKVGSWLLCIELAYSFLQNGSVCVKADVCMQRDVTQGSTAVQAPLQVAGQEWLVTCVSMGNPHAVTFVGDVKNYPIETIGPQVEHHPAFPRRTNTEFIQIVSEREIIFRVWERGAAETLACGTGACAATVAGVLSGRTGRQVLVHLPGGDLDIDWSAADNHVYMTGAAAEVFTGDV